MDRPWHPKGRSANPRVCVGCFGGISISSEGEFDKQGHKLRPHNNASMDARVKQTGGRSIEYNLV